jgi:hypothetical protein
LYIGKVEIFGVILRVLFIFRQFPFTSLSSYIQVSSIQK